MAERLTPERLTPERLSEFDLFAAGKLSEHRRADMLAKGERGSHVWCFDPRAEGNGPVELHSDECHVRTLLAHIDSQQVEIDRLRALLGEARAGLQWLYDACESPDQVPWEGCMERAYETLAKLAQEGLS